MVSDFLTVEWGRLRTSDQVRFSLSLSFLLILINYGCREARIVFKPGKNRNGYFSVKELMEQVEHAINIFEAKTNGLAQGLFMFDNAPGHMKHASNAITARGMVKGALLLYIFFVCLDSVPSQLPNVAGYLYQMGHACVMALTLSLACHSHFISQMTIPFT
ncbi:MAG TPA: hypothetical protein VNX68_01780 [Nitrosopumilaceae archaeon]|nr:hypothetical protein [Nitrosopumilaceae archaeon]